MSRVALFLGAGASRAFGYPTTKEFLTQFKPKLNEIQSRIVQTFEEIKDVEDIEHILQMVDGFVTLKSRPLITEFLKKFGARFTIREVGGVEGTKFLDECVNIKKLIISELFTQYRFSENKVSDVVSWYGRLFKELAQHDQNRELDIFTTNYDSVVEEFHGYAETLDVELFDGFVPAGRSERLFWKPKEAFQKGFRKDADLKLRLFKLHGSLNWCVRRNGEIEKVRLEQQVVSSRRYRSNGNVLIYPAQKTYEEEPPFNSLFESFREAAKTTKVFLVIGFSFRDDLINSIFSDHLLKDARRRLIVVSPSASENLLEGFLKRINGKLSRRVFPIPEEFGKEKTFASINRATLSAVRGRHYRGVGLEKELEEK